MVWRYFGARPLFEARVTNCRSDRMNHMGIWVWHMNIYLILMYNSAEEEQGSNIWHDMSGGARKQHLAWHVWRRPYGLLAFNVALVTFSHMRSYTETECQYLEESLLHLTRNQWYSGGGGGGGGVITACVSAMHQWLLCQLYVPWGNFNGCFEEFSCFWDENI